LLLFALAVSIAGGVLLFVELRSRYVMELEKAVWPGGREAPRVTQSAPGAVRPTVVLLGDSRIAEWPLPAPTGGRVVNAGISGATTARILAEAPGVLREFSPDVVVIEAGINDLKLAGARPDLRSALVDTTAANLSRLVELARGGGARVILLDVWPAGKPSLLRLPVWNSAAVEGAVADVNARIQALEGANVKVCDLFSEMGGRPAYRDTLHLARDAYEPLTRALEPHIRDFSTPVR
jgi:lysophospholipase L1-like esterase